MENNQQNPQKYTIYQVDAFTTKIFGGNPAAVVPLENYLPDNILLKIAMENNLSETAFIVKNNQKNEQNNYDYTIRWFTPSVEINLCGHATLASAYVVYNFLNFENSEIAFNTLYSGILKVSRVDIQKNLFSMDFPAYELLEFDREQRFEEYQIIKNAFNLKDEDILDIKFTKEDYLVIVKSEQFLQQIKPNFTPLLELQNRGIILSSQSSNSDLDFVSRCFYPKCQINEDPTTGSAHCISGPYWSVKLQKNNLSARQISQRVGDLQLLVNENRVQIIGSAALYMNGTFYI